MSLSVTCDEGAHLTEAGCVYNSSCNSCETRLQQAASAVNSGAANVTTAIELFGNLSSAADGFAALDAAAAEDAAILAAITNALDSLYLNVFLVAGGVEASSNILIRFNSNVSARACSAGGILHVQCYIWDSFRENCPTVKML